MENNENKTILDVIKEKSVFDVLNGINVNEHTEVKDNGQVKLTYLSWAWAWAEVKKVYPNAVYEIERFGEDKKPYLFDEELGYMVFTNMTIDGLTHEMWLPVMDEKNKAMKNTEYEYTTKYGKKTVAQATMFDINKTIMRCLVKNISMFGLGLYIYAGEDIPQDEKEQQEQLKEQPKEQHKEKPNFDTKKATAKQVEMINELYKGKEDKLPKLLEMYKVGSVEEFTMAQASDIITKLTKKKEG